MATRRRILAIETSCDETAVAIVEGTDERRPVRILSNIIYSQIDLHKAYGGVYPEAASREHVAKIGAVLETALRETHQFSKAKGKSQPVSPDASRDGKSKLRQYIRDEIDAIAVTVGPGLIGSLLVGVTAAKSLAYAFQKPLIPVHHLAGHIAAAWLHSEAEKMFTYKHINISRVPVFPVLALVVSGGHTQLVWMENPSNYQILGKTRDDAAGEAFDKIARLLGLGYPGGPAVAAAAKHINMFKSLHVNISPLPRPMLDSDDFAFSFSGLKTAVARLVAKTPKLTKRFTTALAYEFQEAVTDVLVEKTRRAHEEYRPRSVILTGGVAANKRLREKFRDTFPEAQLFMPPPALCTDNAAMIGAAAILHPREVSSSQLFEIDARDRLPLGSMEYY